MTEAEWRFTEIPVVCGCCQEIYRPDSNKMALYTESWRYLFSKSFSACSGYVEAAGKQSKGKKVYEVSTTATFTATYQTKGFGNTPLVPLGKLRILNFYFRICEPPSENPMQTQSRASKVFPKGFQRVFET